MFLTFDDPDATFDDSGYAFDGLLYGGDSLHAVYIYFDGEPFNVTAYVQSVSVRRGRTRELDTFTSGGATITLLNTSRLFDSQHTVSPFSRWLRPRVRVRITSEGISIFDGYVEDWNYQYDMNNNSVATVVCIDGLALLSQTTLDEFTNTQDTPVQRITTIVNRPEVSYPGSLNLDPGLTFLQADTVAANTNTLSYLQQVADTDVGRLFVDGSGVLRYRSRTSGVAQSPRVIFGSPDDEYVRQVAVMSEAELWIDSDDTDPVRLDDAGVARTVLQDAVLWLDPGDPGYVAPVIGFSSVDVQYGSEFLFNRVSVERVSGSPVTATAVESQGTYGLRALAKTGLLFENDDEVEAYALYLVGIYANPSVRVASHSLAVHGLSGLHRRYVKRLEIGDVVRTMWQPNSTGAGIDINSIIEGVEHVITPSTHEVVFQLTPFSRAGFILDDANRGVLDGSELTY